MPGIGQLWIKSRAGRDERAGYRFTGRANDLAFDRGARGGAGGDRTPFTAAEALSRTFALQPPDTAATSARLPPTHRAPRAMCWEAAPTALRGTRPSLTGIIRS